MQKKSSVLERHLRVVHGKEFNEYGKEKEALIAVRSLIMKRQASENRNTKLKQPRISTIFNVSTIMKYCIGLVVDGIFIDPSMKSLLHLAKLQESEKIEINPETVKISHTSATTSKREECFRT